MLYFLWGAVQGHDGKSQGLTVVAGGSGHPPRAGICDAVPKEEGMAVFYQSLPCLLPRSPQGPNSLACPSTRWPLPQWVLAGSEGETAGDC